MSSKKLCLTIGDPISHSKGPTIKSMACDLLGIAQEYEFKPYQTNLANDGEIEKLKKFIAQNNVVGISVTMPNKSAVIQICDEIDQAAKFMNAVNTVVIKNNKLYGYNTDYIGIVSALKAVTVLENKKIAILGSGNTTSSALYGLAKESTDITIFNRTLSKAQQLAQKFNVKYDDIKAINCEKFDIIINTTSVGLNNENESPIDTGKINSNNIVLDVIYKPLETKLLREAKKNGAQIIYGVNMLLYVTFPQIFYYTGHQLLDEQKKQIISFFAK